MPQSTEESPKIKKAGTKGRLTGKVVGVGDGDGEIEKETTKEDEEGDIAGVL